MPKASGTPADSPKTVMTILRRRGSRRSAGVSRLSAPTPSARRALSTLRHQGPVAVLWGGLATLGLRRLDVYVMLHERFLARPRASDEVVVRTLAETDIPAYLLLRPDVTHAQVKQRLDRGSHCITAWLDRRLVAINWITPHRAEMSYLGVCFPLREGTFYTHDAFTDAAQRGRGVRATMGPALVEQALAGGMTRIVMAVLPENLGGRGLVRGASRQIGSVWSLRVGSWTIVLSRIPPGYLGKPTALGL